MRGSRRDSGSGDRRKSTGTSIFSMLGIRLDLRLAVAVFLEISLGASRDSFPAADLDSANLSLSSMNLLR